MRAYLPPRASSSSCVPSSVTAPLSMSAMASAPRMTGKVCATMTTVRREDSRLAIALRTASSFSTSRLEVASSSTRTGASFKMARAMAMRWRSPPDSRALRVPMGVSYLRGNAVMKSSARVRRAAARTSSSGAGEPMRILSAIVPLVKKVFWNTTDTWASRSS